MSELDYVKTYYFNYRCRKCGEIISRKETIDPYMENRRGVTIDSKNHKCKFHDGLEYGEKAYCDLISFSENPLSYAYEISDITKENN